MRYAGPFAFALIMLLSAVRADAAEKGVVIRAADLKAQPFLDAATSAAVAANQSVTITRRQGGWVLVESNGKTGWLRMLNVRTEGGGAAKPKSSGLAASLFHTGSSGKTVTTGVKGIGEEDIRNASPNPAQVAALATLAVDPAEATAKARQSGLKENTVAYLDKGSSK